MGIIARQSILTTISSYIGVGLGYINVLFFFPEILNPEELGLYRAIHFAALMLVPIAQLGVPTAIARYHPKYSKNPEANSQFEGYIFQQAGVGFLLFIVLLIAFHTPLFRFFEEKSPQVKEYDVFIVGLVFIMVLNVLMEGFCRARYFIFLPNLLRDVGLKLGAFLAIGLYQYGLISFPLLVGNLILFNGLSVLLLAIFLRKKGALRIKMPKELVPKSERRQLFTFSLFTLAGASAMIIVNYVDSFMITGFLGLEQVAIYTTSLMMAMVVELPKKGVIQSNNPVLAEAFENGDLQKASEVYKSNANLLLAIGILLYIGISANLSSLYQIMPKTDIYSQGYWVFIILGGIKVCEMSLNNVAGLIQFSKYYRFNLFAFIFLGVTTVLTNLWLIPLYGINGAAIATFITGILYILIRMGIVYFKLSLFPYTLTTVKILALGGIAALVGFFLPTLPNVWLDIIVRSALITLAFVPPLLWFRLSPALNKLAENVWHRAKSIIHTQGKS
ncbi:MAG TPA: hypothetical protein DCR93_27865 [Cytophagales bacterium]|nr:hypothetical protein [Cytophagales bacterium]HAP63155.1 hypothetical protein [Cytophagales bacterium]